MKKTFTTKTEAETISLASQIAKIAKRGDVFALYGTLGMGKSVFARGFIQTLCQAEEVPSPTFTLVQEYDAPEYSIYHFDLYRLKSPDEVFELGFEEAVYGGVSLIEWPDKAGSWLPRNIFKVEFVPNGKNRLITISCDSQEKSNRLEKIK